jgi:hypothetical protein
VWGAGAAAFSVNTISFGTAQLRAAVEQGLDGWDASNVPGTSYGVSHGLNGLSASWNGDGVNNVLAADMYTYANCSFPGPIAIAEITGGDCTGGYGLPNAYFDEVDIILNSCFPFTTADQYYDFHDDDNGSYAYSIEQVVLHEAGHAAGLDHWSGSGYPAVMNAGEGGGGVVGESEFVGKRRFYASEDDRVGIRSLYPGGGTPGFDLAVQSYVWQSDGDRYTDTCGDDAARPSPAHDLALMAVAEGRDIEDCPSYFPTNPVDDLLIYQGVSFEASFNYHALGSMTAGGVSADVVLTTDPATLADARVVHSWSTSLSPNTPSLRTHTLTVPADLPPGVWYVVARIDDTNQFGEWDEANNMAVWNRRLAVEATPQCGCSSVDSPLRAALPMSLALSALLVGRRRKRETA